MADLDQADWAIGLFDRPERYLILPGSRGSGKSHGVSQNAVMACAKRRDFHVAIGREFKTTLADGAIALCWRLCQEYGVPATKPRNGNRIAFANGNSIFALGAERNRENLRGLETANVVWLEEAQAISRESFDLLDPSVRRPGAKIVATFNPRYRDDAIYDMFITNSVPNSWVHWTTYGDYPRFQTAALDQARQRMLDTNDPQFAHVWLGELRSMVGSMFNAEAVPEAALWLELPHLPGTPLEEMPKSIRYVRAWDTAATAGGGDYTVGVKLAMRDGSFQIQDVIRGQWGAEGVEQRVRQAAWEDGKGVAVVLERGAGDAGKRDGERWLRVLAGWEVYSEQVRGSKAERARPVASALNAGLISRQAGARWWSVFANELASFSENPADMKNRHDDQVDALSLGYNWLCGRVSSWTGFQFVGSEEPARDRYGMDGWGSGIF